MNSLYNFDIVTVAAISDHKILPRALLPKKQRAQLRFLHRSDGGAKR